MTITLTPELEALVRERCESGGYSTPNAVLQEALELLRHRDALRSQQLAELRREIQIGREQADRGELHDAEEVLAELWRLDRESAEPT